MVMYGDPMNETYSRKAAAPKAKAKKKGSKSGMAGNPKTMQAPPGSAKALRKEKGMC